MNPVMSAFPGSGRSLADVPSVPGAGTYLTEGPAQLATSGMTPSAGLAKAVTHPTNL